MKNKGLLFLFLTIFIDMVGVGILIPVIPQLLGEPSSHFYLLSSTDAHIGFILLGLLGACYSFSMFFASPVLGALSDRYGRRPILLLSIAGTALSYFLFAFAIITKNIPLLFFSRVVDGLTGGNISVAQAAIADQTTPENRAKTYGMIGAAFGIGFIVGPLIGGKLADPTLVGWFTAATPFVFAGILSTINVVSIWYFFRETIVEKQHRAIDFFGSFKNITKAKQFHDVRALFLVSFIANAGFSFFTSFFNVFLTTNFGWGAGQIGNFFAYVGVWIIFTQVVIVRFIAKDWDNAQVLRYVYIITGCAIIAYILPTHPWWILIITPFFSIPNGLQQANFMAFLTKRTEVAVRGEVLGINASVNSLAQALPPLFAGLLASVFTASLPIVFSGVLLVVAGIVFLYSVRTGKLV